MSLEFEKGIDNEQTESDRVASKLEQVLRDPDLSLILGGYMSQLILPGMVGHGEISGEQYDQLLKAYSETLDSMSTPEQRERADREAKNRIDEVSEFVFFRS